MATLASTVDDNAGEGWREKKKRSSDKEGDMSALMRRLQKAVASTVVAFGVMTAPAPAETFDSTIADTRTLAAFRVDADALQVWLPDTHVPSPYSKGAFEGANILMMFIDRILHQDAEGAPKNGGAYRMMALIVPGRHKETDEPAVFISRVYSPFDSAGPYKTQVQASVTHRLSLSGTGAEPLSGRHDWVVEHGGGAIEIGFDYAAAAPGRRSGESLLTTPADTSVQRIYRFDQATDVLLSQAKGVDRTTNLKVSITIPELSELFEGEYTLIGLADRPFYTRQTFKP